MMHDLLEDLADRVMSRFYGKYRGEVTGVEDPMNQGRLRVRCPAVTGTLESMAMPCVPYAGDAVGFYSLPPVGAGVWIEFEGGDPTYPIWTGCYWRENELPSEASGPNIRVWRTGKATVVLDDDADTIAISNDQDASLTFDAALTGKAGQGQVEIAAAAVAASAGGVGKVEVSAAKVSLNDGAMEVT
jgi:hypothetical protein